MATIGTKLARAALTRACSMCDSPAIMLQSALRLCSLPPESCRQQVASFVDQLDLF